MTLSCQHAALMSAVTHKNTHPTLTHMQYSGDQQMITFSLPFIFVYPPEKHFLNILKKLSIFFNLSFPVPFLPIILSHFVAFSPKISNSFSLSLLCV